MYFLPSHPLASAKAFWNQLRAFVSWKNYLDIDEAIISVIRANKRRFPVKVSQSKHTNVYLGGNDNNYKKR